MPLVGILHVTVSAVADWLTSRSLGMGPIQQWNSSLAFPVTFFGHVANYLFNLCFCST